MSLFKKLAGTCLAASLSISVLPVWAQHNQSALIQQVTDQVEQFLIEQAAPLSAQIAAQSPGMGAITVVVTEPDAQQLGDCTAFDVFMPSGRQLAAKSVVGVKCSADKSQKPASILIRADVNIESSQYFARQTLQVNDVITDDVIDAKPVNALSLQPGARITMQQIQGRKVTQRIMAGAAIKVNSTRGAQSIKRGQMVRVEIKSNGLVASSQGEAQAPADVGGVVGVKMSTGKVIQGTLNESGVVSVAF